MHTVFGLPGIDTWRGGLQWTHDKAFPISPINKILGLSKEITDLNSYMGMTAHSYQ